MQAHEAQFKVRLMCRVLEVSASGDYAWRKRGLSNQAQAREVLDMKVRTEFEARKGRAGAPRLARHLKRGRRQVAQSLRRQG
jgi:putative transposase